MEPTVTSEEKNSPERPSRSRAFPIGETHAALRTSFTARSTSASDLGPSSAASAGNPTASNTSAGLSCSRNFSISFRPALKAALSVFGRSSASRRAWCASRSARCCSSSRSASCFAAALRKSTTRWYTSRVSWERARWPSTPIPAVATSGRPPFPDGSCRRSLTIRRTVSGSSSGRRTPSCSASAAQVSPASRSSTPISVSSAPWKTGVLASKPRMRAAHPRCVSRIWPTFMREGTPSGLSTMSTGAPCGRNGMSSSGTIRAMIPLFPWRPAILSPTEILRFSATYTFTSWITPGGSSSGCRILSIWSSDFSSILARSPAAASSTARSRSFRGRFATRSVFRSTSAKLISASCCRASFVPCGRYSSTVPALSIRPMSCPAKSSRSSANIASEMRAFSSASSRRTSPIRSPRSFSTTWSSMREKIFTSMTTPSIPGGTLSDESFTSFAFSPKMAVRSFSSGLSSASPWREIFPPQMSPESETELSPEEKLLTAIFGEKAKDVKDSSLKVPPGMEGVVIDVKIFSRIEDQVVEKDRGERIGEVRRLEADEKARISEAMFAELTELLAGQEVGLMLKAGTVEEYLPQGTKLTRQQLAEIHFADVDLKTLRVANRPLNERLRAVLDAAAGERAKIEEKSEDQIDKILQPDELPPGVIQLVKVYVAEKRKISVGDKMAGRHGNKGIIARIVPEEDMPFLPHGAPVDIVLNPLGVPSRMNVGQILETHLGWAARILGFEAKTPVFQGADETEIGVLLRLAGLTWAADALQLDVRLPDVAPETIRQIVKDLRRLPSGNGGRPDIGTAGIELLGGRSVSAETRELYHRVVDFLKAAAKQLAERELEQRCIEREAHQARLETAEDKDKAA